MGGVAYLHLLTYHSTHPDFPSSTTLPTQANDVGRSITILQTSHAAPCHVQSAVYGESNYLTAMLVAVF